MRSSIREVSSLEVSNESSGASTFSSSTVSDLLRPSSTSESFALQQMIPMADSTNYLVNGILQRSLVKRNEALNGELDFYRLLFTQRSEL